MPSIQYHIYYNAKVNKVKQEILLSVRKLLKQAKKHGGEVLGGAC